MAELVLSSVTFQDKERNLMLIWSDLFLYDLQLSNVEMPSFGFFTWWLILRGSQWGHHCCAWIWPVLSYKIRLVGLKSVVV